MKYLPLIALLTISLASPSYSLLTNQANVLSERTGDTKYFNFGATTERLTVTEAEDTVMDLTNLFPDTVSIIANGNTAEAAKYKVTGKFSIFSDDTEDLSTGTGARTEVELGTLTKAYQGGWRWAFSLDTTQNGFVGTYAFDNLGDNETLFTYVRLSSLTIDYEIAEGEDQNITTFVDADIEANINNVTNAIVGSTEASPDAPQSDTMNQIVPTKFHFGIQYPPVLKFNGINLGRVWGIDLFGLVCPSSIQVNAFRFNTTDASVRPITDSIKYTRDDEGAFLGIIYPYELADGDDGTIIDVMGSGTVEDQSSFEYRTQVKYKFEGTQDNKKYGASFNPAGDGANKWRILFSKNQPLLDNPALQ